MDRQIGHLAVTFGIERESREAGKSYSGTDPPILIRLLTAIDTDGRAAAQGETEWR